MVLRILNGTLLFILVLLSLSFEFMKQKLIENNLAFAWLYNLLKKKKGISNI